MGEEVLKGLSYLQWEKCEVSGYEVLLWASTHLTLAHSVIHHEQVGFPVFRVRVPIVVEGEKRRQDENLEFAETSCQASNAASGSS